MNSVATLRPGVSPLLPIYPSSFEEVVRFARVSVMGGMIKPLKVGYGDNAEIESDTAVEARATMILMQGMELGLPPMQSVQLLAMINGRIVAHSEAVPGLLLSKGFKIKKEFKGTEMADDWTAVCTLTRPDQQVFVGEFSVKDAKLARLWSPEDKITKKGKNNSTYQADNDSAWHRFPKRMLWARALGFAAKDGAADVMRGLAVREEVEDLIRSEVAHDITPKAVTLEIPEIPEVTEQDAAPAIQEADAEDVLADPDGFIARLEEQIALCDDVKELNDIAESNAEMIARLPKSHRTKAAKMLKEAAE
jgi:hypothetical protein